MEVYCVLFTLLLEIKTVKSFLEFIYADKTKGEGRDFDASKYTPSLLKMAHMYQCKELVSACINHLMVHITKANCAEIFAVATLVDSKPLREAIFAQMIDTWCAHAMVRVSAFVILRGPLFAVPNIAAIGT